MLPLKKITFHFGVLPQMTDSNMHGVQTRQIAMHLKFTFNW
jgi:hypothetical protein